MDPGRRSIRPREGRLTRAARLLRSTDATVADVARSVGYRSEEAMSRAFKARFEVAPSVFRARQRAESVGASEARLTG